MVRCALVALIVLVSVGCGARPAAGPGVSGAPASEAGPSQGVAGAGASGGETGATGAGTAGPSAGGPGEARPAAQAPMAFRAAYSAVNFAQSPLILAKEAG